MTAMSDPNAQSPQSSQSPQSLQAAKASAQQRLLLLEALHQITLDIAGRLEPSELFPALVRQACQLMQAEAGGLYLLRPDSEGRQTLVELVARQGAATSGVTRIGEGATGQAIERAAPVLVADYQAWSGRVQVSQEPSGRWQSVLSVPLLQGGTVLGALTVASTRRIAHFGQADIEPLCNLAALAVVAFENARLYSEVRQRLAELEHLRIKAEQAALTDHLTGLPNRRAFEAALFDVCTRVSLGTLGPSGLAMMDLAGFKAVNDRFGHAAGDEALRRIADVTRAQDLATYRLGGDEFAVLLPGLAGEAAQAAIVALASGIESLEFAGLRVRGNFGLAVYPTEADHPDLLLSLADSRMYSAKRLGLALYVGDDLITATAQ
jgi:diguanylate cyclase (GGDEF)-like protein